MQTALVEDIPGKYCWHLMRVTCRVTVYFLWRSKCYHVYNTYSIYDTQLFFRYNFSGLVTLSFVMASGTVLHLTMDEPRRDLRWLYTIFFVSNQIWSSKTHQNLSVRYLKIISLWRWLINVVNKIQKIFCQKTKRVEECRLVTSVSTMWGPIGRDRYRWLPQVNGPYKHFPRPKTHKVEHAWHSLFTETWSHFSTEGSFTLVCSVILMSLIPF